MSLQPVARDYSVRESASAKHARLLLSARNGLVVVVPRGFDRRLIPEILRKKARWVDRMWVRLEARSRLIASRSSEVLPHTVSLQAIGQEWWIDYRQTESGRVVARERPDSVLLVSGDVADREAVRAALGRWMSRKAKDKLVPWLEDVAAERGFVHGPVTVRSQRTRWASCSSKKGISINLKLLFLPEDLVTYVFTHELCHTLRMDHSRRFWALVCRFEPEYRSKNRRLREGFKFVPAWLDPDGAKPSL